MTAEISCAGANCFNVATCEVVPSGRWRNVPIVKACRGCAKKIAASYTTAAGGERGWAEIMAIRKQTTDKATKRTRR